jgi:hypothetical protein
LRNAVFAAQRQLDAATSDGQSHQWYSRIGFDYEQQAAYRALKEAIIANVDAMNALSAYVGGPPITYESFYVGSPGWEDVKGY